MRKLPIPIPRRFSGRTGGMRGVRRLWMDHRTFGPDGRRWLSRRLGYGAPTRGRGGGRNRQRSSGTGIFQGQLRIRLIRRIRGTQGRRIQYWGQQNFAFGRNPVPSGRDIFERVKVYCGRVSAGGHGAIYLPRANLVSISTVEVPRLIGSRDEGMDRTRPAWTKPTLGPLGKAPQLRGL